MTAFSVVIPTYDRAALVVEAVESVLAQTYADREVIVVDNGSTDGTAEALERFGDAIRVVRQGNEGRAGARNRGIAEATGEWIAFLDSDDTWFPDKLERQARALADRPDAGLVHGHVAVIDDEGRPLPEQTEHHRRLFEAANGHPVGYADWALECRCLTSTIAVRRECFQRVGSYDPSIRLEDLDFYLRLLREYNVVFLGGAPLARYRLHASQTANEELAYGRIEAVRKHLALIATGPPLPDERLARRNLLLALADAHNVLMDGRATRRYTLDAVRLDPSLLRDRKVIRRFTVSALPRRARRSRA